jgi:GNAT superfamily N-acetyltransferase
MSRNLVRRVGSKLRGVGARAVALVHERRQATLYGMTQPCPRRGGEFEVRRSPVPPPGDPLFEAMFRTGHGLNHAEARRLSTDARSWVYHLWDGATLVDFICLSGAVRLVEELDLRITPALDAAWVFCGWTAPTHRGRGLFQQCLATIVNDVFDEGGASLWVEVLNTNAASQTGTTRMGFQPVADLRWARTLGRSTQSAQLLVDNDLARQIRAMDAVWLPAGEAVVWLPVAPDQVSQSSSPSSISAS